MVPVDSFPFAIKNDIEIATVVKKVAAILSPVSKSKLEKARERRSKHVKADQKQEDRKLWISAPNELGRLTLVRPQSV